MTTHEASRTLVKSHPELWAECSDAASLARHLDRYGQIRITRLEPESAVAWEGDLASGTVRLEPSGWGTRVSITAIRERAAGAAAGDPATRVGWLAGIRGRMRLRARAPVAPDPRPAPEDTTTPDTAALAAALDSLGKAHHRPFSRR